MSGLTSRLRSLLSPSDTTRKRRRDSERSGDSASSISHEELIQIVLRLSDQVRVEQDGRVALEARVAQLEIENKGLRNTVEMAAVPPLSPSAPMQRGLARPIPDQMEVDPAPSAQPELAQQPPIMESDISRCLVIARMPEPRHLQGKEAVEDDYVQVCHLLEYLGAPSIPTAVYRMPFDRQTSYDRLIKVVLPTTKHQRVALRNAHRLGRRETPPHFREVYVRESIAEKENRPRLPPRRSRPPPRSYHPTNISRPPSLFALPIHPPPPPVSQPPQHGFPSFPPLNGAHPNYHGPQRGNWF